MVICFGRSFSMHSLYLGAAGWQIGRHAQLLDGRNLAANVVSVWSAGSRRRLDDFAPDLLTGGIKDQVHCVSWRLHPPGADGTVRECSVIPTTTAMRHCCSHKMRPAACGR